MKLIERKHSVISGKEDLEQLVVLKHFPVFFSCTDKSPEEDLFADMTWCIERETGIIQLSKVVPLEVLYQMQHVDGCGPTWEKYYNSFASFVSEQKPHRVLEIGGGQGRLAELVTSKLRNSHWTIAEPNPTCGGSSRIKLIPSFLMKTLNGRILWILSFFHKYWSTLTIHNLFCLKQHHCFRWAVS